LVVDAVAARGYGWLLVVRAVDLMEPSWAKQEHLGKVIEVVGVQMLGGAMDRILDGAAVAAEVLEVSVKMQTMAITIVPATVVWV
jgi:hypothetical protein